MWSKVFLFTSPSKWHHSFLRNQTFHSYLLNPQGLNFSIKINVLCPRVFFHKLLQGGMTSFETWIEEPLHSFLKYFSFLQGRLETCTNNKFYNLWNTVPVFGEWITDFISSCRFMGLLFFLHLSIFIVNDQHFVLMSQEPNPEDPLNKGWCLRFTL